MSKDPRTKIGNSEFVSEAFSSFSAGSSKEEAGTAEPQKDKPQFLNPDKTVETFKIPTPTHSLASGFPQPVDAHSSCGFWENHEADFAVICGVTYGF